MNGRIRTVGVVGAGTMGLGIAQVCAAAGFTTIIFDVKHEQIAAALRAIEKNLEVAVEKGKVTPDQKAQTLSRIGAVSELSNVKADLVIEAAVENLEIKRELFSSLEKTNAPDTILASNTSSISILEISRALKNPSRCIGLHFFNPADRMKLVEIISSEATDQFLVGLLREFSDRIGKIPVLAKDSPGFIVNRVARPFYLESLKLLEESAVGIDSMDALLRSAGFKMGPFELMDLIGVDTNLAVTKTVYEGFHQHPKFKPSPIQERLVREGNFGRKTGKGFYEYKNSL